MPRRLDPLTSLRFFAALGVFVFHCGTLGAAMPEWVAFGVSFFFTLSGFILAYAHAEVPSVREFYVKRIARIWPVHLLAFVICVLLLGNTLPPRVTLLNLGLLHAWVPADKAVFSFNSVSWTVADEWFFYLLFPLLIRARRIGPWVIGSALVVVGLILLANRMWDQPLGAPDFQWVRVLRQNPVCRLLEFTVGVALGRHFVRTSGEPPRWLQRFPTWAEVGALAVTAACFAAMTADFDWRGQRGTEAWFSRCGALPGFAAVVLVFAYGRGRLSALLSLPALVLLGEISYATYMLHLPLIRFAEQHALVAKLGLPVTLAVVVAVTYGTSYAVWRWFETPARRAIVARFGGHATRASKA